MPWASRLLHVVVFLTTGFYSKSPVHDPKITKLTQSRSVIYGIPPVLSLQSAREMKYLRPDDPRAQR